MCKSEISNNNTTKKNDNTLASNILEFADSMSQLANRFGKFILNLEEGQIERFSEALDRFPKELVELQRFLMSRGWYSIAELDLNRLGNLFARDDEEVENTMIDFVEESQEKFVDLICDLFPERSTIINSAFEAHRSGKYELSIPLFLIQSDGIAQGMFGKSLYSKKGNKMKLSEDYEKIIAKFGEENEHIMNLLSLTEITSISMNTDAYGEKCSTDNFFSPLNRHAIIHGMSVDYPTKSNSLRCILLLECLRYIKHNYLDAESNESE